MIVSLEELHLNNKAGYLHTKHPIRDFMRYVEIMGLEKATTATHIIYRASRSVCPRPAISSFIMNSTRRSL